MKIDAIHFYVEDARIWRDWFVHKMGFQSVASGRENSTDTEVVTSGPIVFILSSSLSPASPVAQYLRYHPPGVANVAFAVSNVDSVMEKAIAFGAKVLQPIQEIVRPEGKLRWCRIRSVANLEHTLIERHGITPILPNENIVETKVEEATTAPFTGIDHLVLNVGLGELEETIRWYEASFGFERQQTFTIQTERSALYSQVMVHPVSGVKFPVNEPMSATSQIQEFLDVNCGPGIQHIALNTPNIVQKTAKLRQAGFSFLDVPLNYYTQLWESYPKTHCLATEWEDIIKQQILVDCQGDNQGSDSNPLLLQIFTQPIFEKPTFFFELIERRSQAEGFGEGNFRALFEAIEREQLKRGSLQ
ncbi:MAG: 4-hydroxyphenylpyruvate dioxygenase [Chroococcales cyanobacterium]